MPRNMLSVFGVVGKLWPPSVRPQKAARFFSRSPRTGFNFFHHVFCCYLGCLHRVRGRSWRGDAPGGFIFPLLFEVAGGGGCDARPCVCVLKFFACDAISGARAARMLRWEGSRLVSHRGGGIRRLHHLEAACVPTVFFINFIRVFSSSPNKVSGSALSRMKNGWKWMVVRAHVFSALRFWADEKPTTRRLGLMSFTGMVWRYLRDSTDEQFLSIFVATSCNFTGCWLLLIGSGQSDGRGSTLALLYCLGLAGVELGQRSQAPSGPEPTRDVAGDVAGREEGRGKGRENGCGNGGENGGGNRAQSRGREGIASRSPWRFGLVETESFNNKIATNKNPHPFPHPFPRPFPRPFPLPISTPISTPVGYGFGHDFHPHSHRHFHPHFHHHSHHQCYHHSHHRHAHHHSHHPTPFSAPFSHHHYPCELHYLKINVFLKGI